jgi:DNA-binding CsgD family transcriptional regulator/PAS domain-containing protein
MDRSDIETALEITPQFYQAALRFEDWGAVLEQLLPVFGAAVGQVLLSDPVRLEVVAMAHAGMNDDEVRDYLSISSHHEDPRIPAALGLPHRPLYERQTIGEDAWLASSYFNEVMKPRGFDSVIAVHTPLGEGEFLGILGFIRRLEDPPFGPADADRLQLYIPHFRGAMQVAGLVRRLEAERRSFVAFFDRLRIATVIVNRFGRTRYANPAAAALLASGRGVLLRDDRLVAEDAETTRLIHGAVFDAALAADRPGEGRRVIPVRGRNGDAPLLVAVSPVDTAVHGTEPVTEPLAAVFLMDPEARYEGDVEALERLFGLTRAEATLMQHLAAGRRLRDLADESGRSVATLRSHVKAILAKTGVGRQADLVRIVAQISDPLRPPA